MSSINSEQSLSLCHSGRSLYDVYYYSGGINEYGYEEICKKLEEKDTENALLVLATLGGDPNSGFRIARALQHEYGKFSIFVPRKCKSAGTLIAIGASVIYMANKGEFGPLDIQIRKDDELYINSSGVAINEIFAFLKTETLKTFKIQVAELAQEGFSTRSAAEIAAKLTRGIFEPILSQIEPLKFAEFLRGNAIGQSYGKLLNEKSNNLKAISQLYQLSQTYPSHSYVIDRKEAKNLFKNVFRPNDQLIALSNEYEKKLHYKYFPSVEKETLELNLPIPCEDKNDADVELCGD